MLRYSDIKVLIRLQQRQMSFWWVEKNLISGLDCILFSSFVSQIITCCLGEKWFKSLLILHSWIVAAEKWTLALGSRGKESGNNKNDNVAVLFAESPSNQLAKFFHNIGFWVFHVTASQLKSHAAQFQGKLMTSPRLSISLRLLRLNFPPELWPQSEFSRRFCCIEGNCSKSTLSKNFGFFYARLTM